nr:aminopeptidase N-like [Onthophagus taurus]
MNRFKFFGHFQKNMIIRIIWTFLFLLGIAKSYRLPTSVIPDTYKLEIITNLGDRNNFNFTGRVWINLNCTSKTTNITLHSKKLKIDNEHVTLLDVGASNKKDDFIKIKSIAQVKADDFLVIELEKELDDNKTYELFIPFSGKIEEGLAGYYRSSYLDKESGKTKWLAVTQFEPSDARRAFPCFDEPAMKAKFQINLGRSKNFSSISNMPIKSTETMANITGYEMDHYETSVPMSTYLVAYAVSELKNVVSPKSSNVTFKIWARRDALDQVDFAKLIGPKVLAFYEEYFDIKYPLPKQDMIAVPDFSAGAMENWGLITYRETYLLFDPKVTSILSKICVASVVAHELAHQWFGNLVTMKWWTDLWLNEGFATYMAAVAVDNLTPEWKSLQEETVDNLLAVLNFDALQSSHPVSVPIGNPKEISEIFDTISYKKGSYLLHMMSNFLGGNTLRLAVSKYLKAHKYGNAEQDDLWKFITEQAHEEKSLPKELTVKEIMDTWTLQTGYPILNVTREYGTNGTVLVTQERFFKDRDLENVKGDPKWLIPLTYETENSFEFRSMEVKPKLWLPPKRDVKIIHVSAKDDEWIIFNVKATGLYRVNYDQKNWNYLIKSLKSPNFTNIPILNRILLLDDSSNLAWVGRLNYKYFFELLSYLEQETEYLPWKVALRNIGSLEILLKRTSTYGHFKEYIQKLIVPIYLKVGGFKEITETDKNVDVLQHRVLITSTACKYEHEKCVKDAVRLFKDLQKKTESKETIPKDLRGLVYCAGVKNGGEKEWMFLWNLYLNSNVATEKNLILKNLGCTRQTWLLERYLEWAIDSNSGIRRQDVTTVFAAVVGNDLGFYVTKGFIEEHIKEIHERIQPTINKLTTIISNLASYMTRSTEYLWLKNFTKNNEEYFKEIKNGVNQAVETAKLNSQWYKENMKNIRGLLKEHRVE